LITGAGEDSLLSPHGKRLCKRVTEIAIQFPHAVSTLSQDADQDPRPNRLVIHIQPDEGISFALREVPVPS